MIETILTIIAGLYLGWKLREFSAIRQVTQWQEQEEQSRIEKLAEEMSNRWVDMTIDEHEGVFFAYRKDDGSFLGQGRDAIELSAHLRSRFPDKKFTLTKEQLLMIGIYHD